MYGRIDIGSMAAPPVVYAQLVMVVPTPMDVYWQPIYLYVPPAHQAQWSYQCGACRACGQPVYFVRANWCREPGRHGDDDYNEGERRAERICVTLEISPWRTHRALGRRPKSGNRMLRRQWRKARLDRSRFHSHGSVGIPGTTAVRRR